MNTIRLLFNDADARAIVAGLKTVTRRPVVCPGWDPVAPEHVSEARTLTDSDPRIGTQAYFRTHDGVWHVVRPPCLPGDLLIGRECWGIVCDVADPHCFCDDDAHHAFVYRADTGDEVPGGWTRRLADEYGVANRWRPSIHMPDRAARIRRRVVSVTVERLQDITEQDAVREGFAGRAEFRRAWDGIYAGGQFGRSWHDSPWVWRIEFEGVNHVP